MSFSLLNLFFKGKKENESGDNFPANKNQFNDKLLFPGCENLLLKSFFHALLKLIN